MAYTVNEIEQRLGKVRELSTGASLYEQVAEEATELAHAAQKIARYLRGEQPMAEDFDIYKAEENFKEEYGDVLLSVDAVVGISQEDFYIETMESYDKKLDRWVERLEEGAKEKDVHISMDPV